MHLLFLHPAAGMEIVDAGEHIFQSECVMKNAVCGIPERQRQLRCCKLSEEREHQSCQCAFSGAGLSRKKQDKFGFAACFFQKMVEGTEERKRQKRKNYCLRCQRLPEQAGGGLNVQYVITSFHTVAVHFSWKLHGVLFIPREKKMPFAFDLFPPCCRKDCDLFCI